MYIRKLNHKLLTFSGWLLLFCILTSHAIQAAAEQNVNPGINQHYQNPDFNRWVRTFERPGREVYDKRHAIVDQLTIKPGMAIADIGAGTGLFTRLFAQRVGASGKVYAVDISQNFVENILHTANQQGLTNIEGIVSTQQDTRLPENSVDLIFICDTYHHFEYPQTMLTSINKALKPDGRLVIIDFIKQPGISSGWVMTHVRADKKIVIDELAQAGYVLTTDLDMLRSNYYLIFKKAESIN